MPTLYDQRTLTEVVRNMRPPNQFLMNFLFPENTRRTSDTEVIELSNVSAGRKMAPMIKKNGEAILIGGVDRSFSQITAPNIRVKQIHHPHESFGRKAGQGIFNTAAGMEAAQQQKVADDLELMLNDIANREEWLAASLVRGVINYSVTDRENFTLTLPRSAGNTITLTTFWDAAPTTVNIDQDAKQAVRLVQTNEGTGITDAIMGREAADAFSNALRSQNLLDQRRFDTGTLNVTAQEDTDGVTFLGRMFGINWWEYSRQIDVPTEEGGGVFDLIRPKYVEFFNRNPVSTGRRLYYAPVADFDKSETKTIHPVRRFSKSWVKEDPSQRFLLVNTRPLPWFQRPDAYVSMKVVSG